jgi:ABC-2 type transport system permease protein
MKKRNIKSAYNSLIATSLVILIIVVINLISSKVFFRLDLTSEKRYTISEDTRSILKNLNDVVFIRIYLDGELNIPLQNFQKNIVELLDEFKIYGRSNFDYELVDPFENLSEQEQENVKNELSEKGFKVTQIEQRKKDGSRLRKLIIPGAMVIYNGVEIPVNMLLNNPRKSAEENLNNSKESLEYNLISTIKNITAENTDKIAFIEGHGEWPSPFVGDIMSELSKTFQIDRGAINGKPGIMDNYKAIIIAGPILEFSEQDKFVIDQYIMHGGKVLWLLDAVNVNLDSIAMGYSVALPNQLNLEDMLFKYGVRLNTNIIQDAQSSNLMVNVALQEEQPKFQPEQWIYYPLITPKKSNNITNNLNRILLQYAGNIDTISARSNIRKTPLLTSSIYSKIQTIPRVIELSEIATPITQIDFDAPNQLMGVLLEGKFESVFKNRMLDEYFETSPPNRMDESVENKMVVIADADIIRNEVVRTPQGPQVIPLGYDRITSNTYGNKDFLLNVLSYLTDDANLLNLRGREFQLRLLDRKKIIEQRLKWQIINVLLPILIIILAGIIYSAVRKHKYSGKR